MKVFARELSEKALSQSRDLMDKRNAEMKDGMGGPKEIGISFWGSWMGSIFSMFFSMILWIGNLRGNMGCDIRMLVGHKFTFLIPNVYMICVMFA